MPTKKPRVAAIGLDVSQNQAIEWLCGEMRVAASVEEYLERFNWTETDIAVVHGFQGGISGGVHVLMSAPLECEWDAYPVPGSQSVETDPENTEREVKVGSDCPVVYKTLADDLVSHVRGAEDPPSVLRPWWDSGGDDYGYVWTGAKTDVLVETTSHFPLAVRHVRMYPIGYGAGCGCGMWENLSSLLYRRGSIFRRGAGPSSMMCMKPTRSGFPRHRPGWRTRQIGTPQMSDG